jgi:hypothetical protein
MNIIDWGLLTSILDYHHQRWYEGIDDRWVEIKKDRVTEILNECAAGDDHEWIKKRFIYRDRESHARSKDTKREAQLQLGDWLG